MKFRNGSLCTLNASAGAPVRYDSGNTDPGACRAISNQGWTAIPAACASSIKYAKGSYLGSAASRMPGDTGPMLAEKNAWAPSQTQGMYRLNPAALMRLILFCISSFDAAQPVSSSWISL